MKEKFFSTEEDFPTIIHNTLVEDFPDIEIGNIELNKQISAYKNKIFILGSDLVFFVEFHSK